MLTEKEELELLRLLEAEEIDNARNDFYSYCRYMDTAFFTLSKIHLKVIAESLQGVLEGSIPALAISLPPRAGKSYVVSLFCSWVLGKNKTGSIMRNSYAAKLAEKFSKDIRDGIMTTPKYGRVFPGVETTGTIDNWSTKGNTQPSYFCAGVGGPITGFGCKTLAILDDPIKNIEEALSETVIDNVWNWYTSTHLSRLESGCPEIHIATRWSRRDPIGRMTDPESEYYRPEMKVIVISALDDEGNSFCEEIKTTQEYHSIKKITDSFIWEAEYMQKPVEAKGLLYPVEILNRFSLKDIKTKKPDGILGFTDTADRGEDYLCSLSGKRFGDYTYITDVVFTQDGVEITEPLVAAMIIDTKTEIMKIESNNGGSGYARNIRKLVRDKWPCSVIDEPTTTNKETRMLMNSGYVKEYFYFRSDYEPGSDYDKFMRYLTSYVKLGKNKHDDAPDAVTGLAEYTKTKLFSRSEAPKHYNFDFERKRDQRDDMEVTEDYLGYE